jgi:hypothetical protein
MRIAKDKRKHFLACLAISLSVGLQMIIWDATVIVAFLSAFYPGLWAGLAKEFADEQNGGVFDLNDLVADILGSLLGASLTAIIIALI